MTDERVEQLAAYNRRMLADSEAEGSMAAMAVFYFDLKQIEDEQAARRQRAARLKAARLE